MCVLVSFRIAEYYWDFVCICHNQKNGGGASGWPVCSTAAGVGVLRREAAGARSGS
jgi:hypothetical protein